MKQVKIDSKITISWSRSETDLILVGTIGYVFEIRQYGFVAIFRIDGGDAVSRYFSFDNYRNVIYKYKIFYRTANLRKLLSLI